jgi:hypothetical protein
MRGLVRTRQRKISAAVIALVGLVAGVVVGINAASSTTVNGLGPLDHYLCYAATGQKTATATVVAKPFPQKPIAAWLQNQFDGGIQGKINGLQRHCNPVRKTTPDGNFVPVHNLTDHLVCFGFTPNANFAPPIVNVTNQFSPIVGGSAAAVPLAVGPLQSLCLPSFKSNTAANLPPGAPTDLDHYACYKVSYPAGSTMKFVPPPVTLKDQFSDLLAPAQQLSARVLTPQSLCLPTIKIIRPNPFTANPTINDLIDKNDHLLCFGVAVTQPAGFVAPNNPWFDSNQFGVGQLNITRPNQLCVPSLKDVPPPPPTSVTTATTIVGQTTTPTTPPCDPATGANCNVKPPLLSKHFGDTQIAQGGTTSLTFIIQNPNSTSTLTNISFNDPLAPNFTVASPNGLVGSCPGGVINAPPGGAAVSMTGAFLAPLTTCAFKVDVTATATAAGLATNVTGPITAMESGPGLPATATIQIG